MARGFTAGAAALAALAVLGGCSVFGGSGVPCPTVGVVNNAGQLTRFGSGGSDLTDIEFQAHVRNLKAECSFDGDTRTGSIDLDILFHTQRGPASSATRQNFDYFVAVVDPDGGIAARKAFSVQVAFEGSRTEAARVEPLVLDVPIRENTAFATYRIYVGMELTKEQLEHNLGRGR